VGLAARFLEEKGFSTVVLTPTWEFHRALGIPRQVAIEYPYGRPIGRVGDTKEQREILKAVLTFLEETQTPGAVGHLPRRWHEAPKETHWHPPEMSPIIAANLKDIKKARKKG
jgi:hypothetical protein